MTASNKELEKVPGMTKHTLVCCKLLREVPMLFLKEGIIGKKAGHLVQEDIQFSLLLDARPG